MDFIEKKSMGIFFTKNVQILVSYTKYIIIKYFLISHFQTNLLQISASNFPRILFNKCTF